MYYIGVDLGTSSVKLILMDEEGRICASVSESYPQSFPKPGWSEQDPMDWWEKTKLCIRRLTARFPGEEIAGISFGGQMHGLVLLDGKDKLLRPAILWNDGRTQEETDWLNREIGVQKLADYTGNIAFAGFTAPKILWVKRHEPEIFAKIAKICLPKDYIAYRLSGVHCTDFSDASGTLLLDVKNRCWSKEMLDICAVSSSQLPKLFESEQVVGTILPHIARELGLNDKVKIIAGAGDNAAGAVGTGTVADGACNISIGTSGTVFIASDSFRLPEAGALHTFAHAGGKYHLMGCILSAAACNKWWTEEILSTADYEKAGLGITADGKNPVFFAPYLMGERTPHNDAAVRGGFVGLSMDTTRAQMAQAVMEGVAFAFRDCLSLARELGVSVTKTKICGGGAKSRVWREIVANVLNVEVQSIEAEEGPALGAAMLAAVGCGAYDSVSQLGDKIVRVTETIAPDPESAARYDAGYEVYKRLYPALKSCFI